MKRILVTGGSGFIGSAIVKRLSKENHYVRVFDNGFRGSGSDLSKLENIELFKGDIRNLTEVTNACKDIDIIIHLAYINGTKYFYEFPELVLEVGVKGMLNVLDAAKANRVTELYLASSSEVYQTPPIIPTPEDVPFLIPDAYNPRYSYAAGKIISELLSLYMGKKIFKKVVIFRPHNVFGPNMGNEHVIPELIGKIIKSNKSGTASLTIQGDGKNTRAFIYIDDFVDGVMILLKKGVNNETYNIGTSEEISILDLINKLSKVTGVDIKITKSKLPQGSTMRRCPDVTKISKLGFKSKTSLIDGLQKTYLCYNKDLNDE